MEKKKALIIGAGIAGLCAGIYLRKNGWDTEILEMHGVAGGLATAWKRQGFTFENCVHWLVGSRPGGELNATWKEVVDIEKIAFHEPDVLQVLEKDGGSITFYRNVDRLEAELLAKAPEDEAAIRELCRSIRRLSSFRMPGGTSLLPRLASYLGAIPYLPLLSRYTRLSMADFAKRLKNPLLREFFAAGMSELSLIAIVFSFAWMTNANAGYPIGGSLKLIGLIEERYRSLGGRIRFGARVGKILVQDGRANGVVLDNGERIGADVVVSAADGHATIFEMLEGRYTSERIKSAYKTYAPFPSYVQVSLGVGAELKGEPECLYMGLDRKLEIDPQTKADGLAVRVFHFDPTFAPAGKTAATAIFATRNDSYWRSLRETDRARYDAEKRRIGSEVAAAFEARFPAARGRIEVVDVATPATIVRYTGNWQGSMEGWLLTPATGTRPLPDVLPGLAGFYMVGQWISPGGGLPSGLMTARAVSRRVCRDHRLPWRP